MRTALFALLIAGLAPTSVFALEAKVEQPLSVDAKTAWAAIGDFCGIAKWHPAVADCQISKKGGKTLRTLTLKGGGKIVEQQVAFDARGMKYTYTIVESPLPVANYKSTISVKPSGKTSKLLWVGSFKSKGAPDAEAVKAITGIYQAGADSLAKTK